MPIIGVDHTSFTVSNLERSLEFYIGLLGCELLWRRDISDKYFRDIVGIPDCVVKAAHLRLPGTSHKLELFEYVEPRGAATDLPTHHPGSAHVSFLVDDLPTLYASLVEKGVRFRSAPIAIDHGANAGGYAVYLLDPDGIAVELFQPARRAP